MYAWDHRVALVTDTATTKVSDTNFLWFLVTLCSIVYIQLECWYKKCLVYGVSNHWNGILTGMVEGTGIVYGILRNV